MERVKKKKKLHEIVKERERECNWKKTKRKQKESVGEEDLSKKREKPGKIRTKSPRQQISYRGIVLGHGWQGRWGGWGAAFLRLKVMVH